ncbi:helicase, putative [Syntrophotalea carbinolica DSM 2380]|uniref:ATP-dependent DNA helicase RecQ n=1 Tax=Syntrophotalea carbinolica (strain DSM 2380 / NBRC 103641 / GraBd1) TaxID=338963 RepID=Q3A2W5_SYNC1|nr:ATP-dependent DNA helicase RecQ [Syntrophotalea carbinolica]ABA89292.1 helicase, putative [Syntrophotalea carbinolica DSM 2380]
MPAQTIHRCLQEKFGFSTFRPGQEAVIDSLLAGHSALAIFPTGGGKSLCYQLPALLMDGLTLVISPLIALMKDQVDALRERGIMAARLDSSIGADEIRTIYRDLADGSLKILYIAPERLSNERFLHRLQGRPIALLAVDEAHCISEWGHNFRPEYLKIARMAEELKVGRVLALTATATPDVADDIRRAFHIADNDQIQTSFHRPNLHLTVSPCPAPQRRQQLLQRLRQRPVEPTIVYVTLQKTAEQIAAFLADEGIRARAYHAGLKTEERTEVQNAFMADDLHVVVATIAFGMGIDKADIRAIYHYNLPKTLENYMQEIGRAGRDGNDAHCEIFACADDLTVLANFSYGDTPVPDALASLVEYLLDQSETFSVSHYELAGRFDIRPLVIATIFTYLELNGVLRATGPFYDSYKVRFNRSPDKIIAGFDPQRGAFLRDLFATARPGRIWSHLTPDKSAAELNQPRSRITAAIGYLEEEGDLTTQVTGLRHGYRFQTPDIDSPKLIADLQQTFAERERRNISRLHGVLAYAEQKSCLTRQLLDYFGEKTDADCNDCSRCQGGERQPLPRTAPLAPGTAEAEIGRRVRAENHPALSHPRQLARFLCGISSPAATRAKLSRHPDFGALGEIPFQKILAMLT